MENQGKWIFLQVAAGSSQNLKPDLVMETFCRFLDIPDEVRFGYCRLEMYAFGEDGKNWSRWSPLDGIWRGKKMKRKILIEKLMVRSDLPSGR